uniref:L1 transposable element RRM domain-containing protein n=1 Tax=Salarias fasciatus TaxID=181472 RepID=A0A672IJM8_SALFA
MSGSKPQRGQKSSKNISISQTTTKKDQMDASINEVSTELTSKEAKEPGDEMLREIYSISKDLREFKNDIHAAISELKGDIKKDLKDEMTALKEELSHKLAEMGTALQDQAQAISEAEERISDVEASGSVTKEALLCLLKEQRKLQQKVTDLESRSRRNNIRIYGVPEEAEGDSMIKFIDSLLTTELPLPEGMPLKIQRAHRALVQKPGPDATPRSVVVNFLQFDVKETVLKLAWKKKVLVNNKQVFFDHDYASEVMEKRRAYGGIKKALKQQGIRFQTPFTRIRIHWNTEGVECTCWTDISPLGRAPTIRRVITLHLPTGTLEGQRPL